MLLFITIVVVAAGVAYLITKNKAHLSSLETKIEEAVTPAIEEVKEVVEKAAEVAPKNKTIKQVKAATDTIKTKKPAAKTSAKKNK